MTTIAFKSGILAADTRATNGSGRLISDNFQKIFDVEGKGYTLCGEAVRAYALSGYVFSRLTFDAALEQGIQVGSTLDTDDDFSAIVITESRSYAVSKEDDNSNIRIIEIPSDVYWAIGSGADVARYVMQVGGDPVKAVIEACKVDVASGGEVDVWQK